MVTRELQAMLIQLATKFPFVTITGSRQSGKSTLARMAFPDYRHVSLEDLCHSLEYVARDIEYAEGLKCKNPTIITWDQSEEICNDGHIIKVTKIKECLM